VVAEVAAPGTPHTDDWATLVVGEEHRLIRWSVVGMDDIGRLARRAGLRLVERLQCGERWCAVLEEPA
jgi:hypothetical protein